MSCLLGEALTWCWLCLSHYTHRMQERCQSRRSTTTKKQKDITHVLVYLHKLLYTKKIMIMCTFTFE